MQKIITSFLAFLIILLSLASNLPDNFISRLGFDSNILLATLCAIVITFIISNSRLLLVALVVGLCVGSNMPETMAQSIGVDRDYLVATLAVFIMLPLFLRDTQE